MMEKETFERLKKEFLKANHEYTQLVEQIDFENLQTGSFDLILTEKRSSQVDAALNLSDFFFKTRLRRVARRSL